MLDPGLLRGSDGVPSREGHREFAWRIRHGSWAVQKVGIAATGVASKPLFFVVDSE